MKMTGSDLLTAVALVGILAFVIVPRWRIFKRLGCNPALALLAIVPIVNFAVFYYVAYSNRPYPAGAGKG